MGLYGQTEFDSLIVPNSKKVIDIIEELRTNEGIVDYCDIDILEQEDHLVISLSLCGYMSYTRATHIEDHIRELGRLAKNAVIVEEICGEGSTSYYIGPEKEVEELRSTHAMSRILSDLKILIHKHRTEVLEHIIELLKENTE